MSQNSASGAALADAASDVDNCADTLTVDDLSPKLNAEPVLSPSGSSLDGRASSISRLGSVRNADMFLHTLDAENQLLRSQVDRLKASENRYTARIASTELQKTEMVDQAISMCGREIGRLESAQRVVVQEKQEQIDALLTTHDQLRSKLAETERLEAGRRAHDEQTSNSRSRASEVVEGLTRAVVNLQHDLLPDFTPERFAPAALVDIEPSDDVLLDGLCRLSEGLGLLRLTFDTKLRASSLMRSQLKEELAQVEAQAISRQEAANTAANDASSVRLTHQRELEAVRSDLTELTGLHTAQLAEVRRASEEREAEWAKERASLESRAAGVDAIRAELAEARKTISSMTAQAEESATTRARLLSELTRLREEGSRATLELDGLKSRQKFVGARPGQRDLGVMVDRLNREVTRLTEEKARLEEAARVRPRTEHETAAAWLAESLRGRTA